MTVTLNFTERDKIFVDYIQENNIDTSNLSIHEFLELLEDAQDLHDLRLAQTEDDGTRYSHEEAMRLIGLTQEDLDNVNLSA